MLRKDDSLMRAGTLTNLCIGWCPNYIQFELFLIISMRRHITSTQCVINLTKINNLIEENVLNWTQILVYYLLRARVLI